MKLLRKKPAFSDNVGVARPEVGCRRALFKGSERPMAPSRRRVTRGDRHPVRGEMDKREFQQSKVAMLDFFDDLIGVERGNAHRNAGSAE